MSVVRRTQLVVLGMHRSGTSILAALLELMGAYVGGEADKMPPQPDNPRGFWERNDVVELNDKILSVAGGSWRRVHALNFAAVSGTVRREITDELTQVVDRLNDHRPWLVKDPRFCLTLPFWMESLSAPIALLAQRNPLEIAFSLFHRNALPISVGLALWEVYSKSALIVTKDMPRLLVRYRDLVNDPLSVVSDLLEELKALGADGLHMPEDSELMQLVDKRMQHENCSEETVTQFLSPAQLRFWEDINTAGISKARAEPQKVSEAAIRVLSDFADVDARLQWAEQLERRQAHQIEELERRQAHQIEELERQIEELERRHLEEIEERQAEHVTEIRTLESWIRELWIDADATFSSLRWRIGTAIVRSAETMALRRRRHTVRDHIEQVIEEFKTWRTSRASRYGLESLALPKGMSVSGTQSSVHRLFVEMIRHPGRTLRLLTPARVWNFFITCFKQPAHVRREILRDYVALYEQAEGANGKQASSWIRQLPDTPIVFPKIDVPEVSVLVPVFNCFDTTLSCLAALHENSKDVMFEVILADDASTDRIRNIEKYCENVRVIRSEVNQGFLRNCNTGATAAKGRFLFLLNNDAFVQSKCLRALLEIAQKDESVGIVGPKLVYPNGTLQEAGGIVWKDGSAWNYGRGDDPARPEYNYVKEVDYVSGAAILIRRDLWDMVGGFDERFAPAYYEDTDLAFQARTRGYRVVYQPKAQVVHEEGVSHGTDEGSTGIKKHQALNRAKFVKKWHDELEHTHYRNGESVLRARERGKNKVNVLVVDHYVPEFDKDAGSKSTLQYLQLFVEQGAHVKFLPDNFLNRMPYTSILEQLGIEVLYGDWYSKAWKRWWRENGRYFDIVYLHRPHVTQRYIDVLRRNSDAKLIYFGHDLHYLRVEREYKVTNDAALKAEAQRWRRLEHSIITKSDVVYFPSVVEVAEIKKHFPEKCVRAIPLYITSVTDKLDREFGERTGIFFVGGFRHTPNVDGIQWFVKEVFPQIVEMIPSVKFVIAGSRAPDEIVQLAASNIVFRGEVSEEELAELYERARVVVVPLRFGAGVKGKVLEAMRYRVPVVTTSIGAEGLPMPADYLEIADDADGFAEKVVEVYNTTSRWNLLSERGTEIIRGHFSKECARNAVGEDFRF